MNIYNESISYTQNGSCSLVTTTTTNQIAHDLLRSNSSNSSDAKFTSQIESAILSSTEPISLNEAEEITVTGNRGIWVNKSEVLNWKGSIPIEQYSLNEDANPQVILKKSNKQLEYIQELAIRYLRPPTPAAPGEIIIRLEGGSLIPPAPPLIIRQQPPRPATPEPLVIREEPPHQPKPMGQKLITISGKKLPPPPRKVVIERLPQLPSKPQSVIVERWLPFRQAKRRVILQREGGAGAFTLKPRNVIVQWEAPPAVVKTEVKYLGVVKANPSDYVAKFGASLKAAKDLPQFVLDVKTPDGLELAAESKFNGVHELEGDVSALNFVDLDAEGLSAYRAYLQSLNSKESYPSVISSVSVTSSSGDLVEEIFRSIDLNSSGKVSVEEAEKAILKLNRAYSEADVSAFFKSLDTSRDGSLDLKEFRRAFNRLI